MNNYIETNRHAWDLRTGVHLDSEFYDVQGFRAGAITLHPPELDLVGEVKGLRLLHLQCHFGLDTLSWGRLGAIATGVDFSPVALAAARRLASETGIAATFIQADVQDLGERFLRSFDLVVSTYGVLCWLHDLEGWARGIRNSLAPKGRFILVEYHPLLDLLFDGQVSGECSYFKSKVPPRAVETKGTYTDHDAPIAYREYRSQHAISEVVNTFLNAGLHITDFREYPYSSYKLFPTLDISANGVWMSSKYQERVPFMYSIIMEP
jgi:SAM-dependent methyltransferase